jgi:hypothetical protein
MKHATLTTSFTLGSMAIGVIGPGVRIASHEITSSQVLHFCHEIERVDSLLYQPLEFHQSFMPRFCIDGRHFADFRTYVAPNSAGGVFTLLVSDMLTSQTFRNKAKATAEYAKNLFTFLNEAGYEGTYGDHDQDIISRATASGCGAVDNMPKALAFIAQHGDALRELAKALNVQVHASDHNEIIQRAKELTDDQTIEASTGASLRGVLANAAGEESIITLRGAHHEVVLVINNQEGTSINPAAYDDTLQAFNYDRWAMKKAVHVIGHNIGENEARRKLLAADYFNLATVCLLASPSLYVLNRPR